MSAGFWVAAQTKAQRERWAAENVARQGFNWYLPVTQAVRVKNGHKEQREVCLFPRYLFVWTEGRWRSLLGTFGITGLVMSGQTPSIVPERAIEEIKAREDSSGHVRLAERAGEPLIKCGQSLRVNYGSFSGYQGVAASHSDGERVSILLDFLGRKTKVLIAQDHVELA